MVGGSARTAGTHVDTRWPLHAERLPEPSFPTQRAALVEHYVNWALAEHASIASFARFALELAALGAPPGLIREAIAAQADETRHARIGFGFVRALSGHAIGPTSFYIGPLGGHVNLEHVLRDDVRTGMIAETLAALELRVAAEHAGTPELRSTLRAIGADEARHAALAYRFGAFALARDPALAAVIEQELADWRTPEAPARPGLEPWGVVDATERMALARTGFDTLVVPLVEQLLRNARAQASARPTRSSASLTS